MIQVRGLVLRGFMTGYAEIVPWWDFVYIRASEFLYVKIIQIGLKFPSPGPIIAVRARLTIREAGSI